MAKRYETPELLGQGAGGAVYRVFDVERGEWVALKRLLDTGDTERLRFAHEYWRLKRLAHPGIVAAFDYGEDAKGPYYTMELVEGDAWPTVSIEPARAAALIAAACSGLGYLHGQGLVHGDLKPDNLRVLGPTAVKLLDLGFLQQAGRGGQQRGTLEYMAPEVLQGAPADPRADLYALGTLAYALIAGHLPFAAQHPLGWVQAQLHQVAVPLDTVCPGLDPALAACVMGCLSKAAGDRPPTAAHLAASLLGGSPEANYLVFGSEAFGLDATRDALLQDVQAQLAGSQGALVVQGVPGSGKSRLLVELATPEASWTLLRAEAGEDLPYELLSALLREAEGLLIERGLDVQDDAWSPLRALMPAWGPAAEPLEPSQQEGRLRQALATLLARLAGSTGLVVALDDFDRADSASRAIFGAFLNRQVQAGAAGLAWVTSAAVATPSSPQAGVLTLAPLDAAATAALVSTALGEAPPVALLDRLLELAEGNPARLRALLEAWHGAGALARVHGHWVWEPTRASAVPADLAAAARAAFEALPSDIQRVGQAAAVLGAEGTVAALQKLSGQPPFQALLALESAHMVRENGQRFRFIGAAREGILATLAAAKLQEWHRAAAGLYAHSVELADRVRAARHLLVGDLAGGGEIVLEAAKASFEQGALSIAADLLKALPPDALLAPAQQERARLLGDLARTRGEGREALLAYDEAIGIARALGLQAALTRELVSLGRTALGQSEPERARTSLEEALPLARAHQDAAQTARALLTLARLAIFEGHPAIAREHLEEALAASVAPGLTAFRAAALSQLGTLGAPADVRAREALGEARRLHQDLKNPVGWLDASINLADRLLGAGELAPAEQVLSEALEVCRSVGAFAEEVFVLLNLAQARLDAGRFGAALETAVQARRQAAHLAMPFPEGYAQVFIGLVTAKMGEYVTAGAALTAAIQAAEATQNKYLEAAARLAAAQLALEMGEAAKALEALDAAQPLAEAQGDPALVARSAWLRGRIDMLRGNSAAAATGLASASQQAHAAGAKLAAAMIDLAQGAVALEQQDFATAVAFATTVSAYALGAGAQELVAEAHWLQGEAANRQGHGDLAHAHFAAVRSFGEGAPCPLWQALGLLGVARSSGDQTSLRAGERILRGLRAAAGTDAFWGASERQIAVPSHTPAPGLLDTVAMFADLKESANVSELIGRLLQRVLDVSGASAGAFLIYRAAQLEHFTTNGLSDTQVLENDAIDRALWERVTVDVAGSVAIPLVTDDAVVAIVYLVGVAATLGETTHCVVRAAGEVVAHFRALERLHQRVERLAFTQSIAVLALRGLGRDEILREALLAVLAITAADRALIVKPTAHGEVAAVIGMERGGRELPANAPVSGSVCQHVLSTYEPVRLMDAQRLEGWQQQQSILALGLQTIVAVPVLTAGRARAVLYVDSANVIHMLGAREQSLLEAAADILAPLIGLAIGA
jgi:tetratricopeptide (TPR) repeat protein